MNLWYILGCELAHFVIGASVAFSVLYLTLTTLSSGRGSYTLRSRCYAIAGLLCASLSHCLLDWWGAI
jgi:hypothetical protein